MFFKNFILRNVKNRLRTIYRDEDSLLAKWTAEHANYRFEIPNR